MPATNKEDLLKVTWTEYAKLQKLLGGITSQVAMIPDEEETTIKDVIGHRAHWIDLFLGWYRDGQKGLEVSFPAPGYKWNELKRFNADLRDRQKHLNWVQVQEMLQESHDALLDLLEGLSNDALYGAPMKGARNDWTTGRWAEAAGPSHFRSASKYLRSRLRDAEQLKAG